MAQYKDKRLFVFDLDGTLTPSKSPMEQEMTDLILRLIDSGKKLAVISGGAMPQYEKQFLNPLQASPERLKHIFLFPTCGAAFYKYENNQWKLIYENRISEADGNKIKNAFQFVLAEALYPKPVQIYGDLIEHRGTQVTFSALGQLAPLELKHKWDPEGEKRLKLREALLKYIPEFDIKLGGTTSLDIAKIGIDKAFGIRQMEKYLGISQSEMLYFGDRVFPGGNDYPVKLAGVETVAVTGPADTKNYLRAYLQSS